MTPPSRDVGFRSLLRSAGTRCDAEHPTRSRKCLLFFSRTTRQRLFRRYNAADLWRMVAPAEKSDVAVSRTSNKRDTVTRKKTQSRRENGHGIAPASDLLHKLSYQPAYRGRHGAAFVADSRRLLSALPADSVNLVLTSPPYALHFKKEYGNVEKKEYVDWFLPFAREIHRALRDDGSFVLNIGGSYNPGTPTRSLYHFKLLIALVEQVGFHLAQECFWYNPAKLPAPAEWVTVRRQRIKDSVEYVWWLSKTPWPKADNRKVLVPYSPDMERLIKRGYRAKLRPSGHNITGKFQMDRGGAIPSSVIERGNNESNSEYIKACQRAGLKIHPARFPAALPEFFIKLCTEPGEVVVDPFAGSNTTGYVAESLGRTWISSELDEEYVKASSLRFSIEGNTRDSRSIAHYAQSPLPVEPVA